MHRWKFPVFVGLVLIVAAIGGGSSGTAHAATTRVWTGAVSLNWNTAGNWNPAGVPVDGDSVVLGAAAAGKTLNNNRPVGLALESLTIATGTTVVGNRLGIGSALAVTATNVEVNLDLPISLTDDTNATLATGVRLFMRDRLSPIGTIALETNGHRLTKMGGEIEFNGDVTGSGELRNAGGNEVLLMVPVTLSGVISATAGTRVLFTYYLFRPTLVCGSAANAAVVLISAELAIVCVSNIRSISGTGTLQMFSENSRLFIAGSGTGAVFNGNITGAAPSTIICCSNGAQTFKGTSSYTGLIVVTAGALSLEGATFPAAASFTVQGGGGSRPALAGYGSFGETILTSSVLSLASLNGKFGFARFPSLQFGPDVGVEFEIKGPTPGLGFTQILMSGQIVLDNALLDLDFGLYKPPVGQSLVLVYGATALLDTFHNAADGKNLPEGATFNVKGPLSDSPGSTDMKFKITYKGGAGHDVVITRLADPVTPGPAAFKRYLPMVAREN